MKDEKLHQLFSNLKDEFDTEVPNQGHENRFLNKLNAQQTITNTDVVQTTPKTNWYKPLLGMVASIALLVAIFINKPSQDNTYDLASVSPELAETQSFFTATIESELEKLQAEATPATKALVDDAVVRLDKLEEEYKILREDLKVSGNDKRVIYAMISNFQTRIDLLQNVLEHIESVKQLKQLKDEKATTI